MKANRLVKLALAWLPFAILWTLINLSYEDIDTVAALRYGVLAIGIAAVLGVGVWRFTGRYPWPDHLTPGFYLTHAGMGCAFAAAWMLAGQLANGLLTGASLFAWELSMQLTFWRFLMGLWLYGFVAGVSYSLRFRDRLREQERIALAAEAHAAQARLESLRAQLNPHFLFNALHSVSALVHEDAAAADRALETLAGLIRYSLDEETGDTVTLEEECGFVFDYLAIERLRLGDRLVVETDLPAAALSCRVPSFTLQVLVENAIRHGIAPRPGVGRIRVGARAEDGTLRLSVSDDGLGITPSQPADGSADRVEGAPSRAADRRGRHGNEPFTEAVGRARGGGRGLSLLRQRLAVQYGDRAKLILDSAPGGGTRVELELPAVTSSTPS